MLRAKSGITSEREWMSEIRMAPVSDKHYEATILERRELSEDLWLVKVDPGGPFQFKAGQYATLGFDFEGRRISGRTRSYLRRMKRDCWNFSWSWCRKASLLLTCTNCIQATSCIAGKLPKDDSRWI